MKEYKVQLDPTTVEEVDQRVGTYRRSAFIRNAMRFALSNREAFESEFKPAEKP